MYKIILNRKLFYYNSLYLKSRYIGIFCNLFKHSSNAPNVSPDLFLNLNSKCYFSTNVVNGSISKSLFHTNTDHSSKADNLNNHKIPSTSSQKSEQTNKSQHINHDDSSSKTDSGEENNGNGDNKSDNKLFKYIPAGMYGGATLVFSGILLSYYIERRDELKNYKLSQILDDLTQYMYDKIEELFPGDNIPLLPDFDELKYPPNLPTLVIDLDKVVAKVEYDRKLGWQVKKRPYADKFFKELINYYEIVIWSDDSYPVAYDIANLWGLPVIGCIHRDHCKKFKGGYIKDLSRLGRDLNRVILIDHDRIACTLQEENAILVKEFDGDENDEELLYLINLLKTVAINPQDVKLQIKQLGGGHDYQLGRRFAEQYSLTQEKAKSRMNMTKMLGFKHYQ